MLLVPTIYLLLPGSALWHLPTSAIRGHSITTRCRGRWAADTAVHIATDPPTTEICGACEAKQAENENEAK